MIKKPRQRFNIGRFFVIPLFLLVAILQSTLIPLIRVFDGIPNLALIFVVCWLLLNTPEQGVIWALTAGLTLDVLSSAPFGMSTVAMVCAAGVVMLVLASFRQNALIAPVVGAALGTVVFQGVSVIILAVFGRPLDLSYFAVTILLPSVGLNILLALVVYQVLRRFNGPERGDPGTTGRMAVSLNEFRGRSTLKKKK